MKKVKYVSIILFITLFSFGCDNGNKSTHRVGSSSTGVKKSTFVVEDSDKSLKDTKMTKDEIIEKALENGKKNKALNNSSPYNKKTDDYLDFMERHGKILSQHLAEITYLMDNQTNTNKWNLDMSLAILDTESHALEGILYDNVPIEYQRSKDYYDKAMEYTISAVNVIPRMIDNPSSSNRKAFIDFLEKSSKYIKLSANEIGLL